MTRTVPGKSQFDNHPVIQKRCANPTCQHPDFETRDPRQVYCGRKCSGRVRSSRWRSQPTKETT